MIKPTRLLTVLTAAGLVAGPLAVAAAGSAAAALSDSRYSLFAQGDSQYYQADGNDIPVSPKNKSGSLTAQAQTDNTGSTTSFAGAPYFGATAQTAPGIINAVPNQFGYPHPLFPFSQFPGYVQASYPSQASADDSNYYYKVHAEAAENSAKASGSNGAPDSIPAPNQQQVATAEVGQLGDGSTLTTAFGSAAGFVQGPLEVGYSAAKAVIKDAGAAPKIESSVFGKFSVGGQDFGYTKAGFTYLGQAQDKKAALDGANTALKAAGMQIEIAPETTSTDPANGITTYTLGGLKITSVFNSPTGNTDTFGYILGRVEVASVNAPSGSSGMATTVSRSAGTLGGIAPSDRAPAAGVQESRTTHRSAAPVAQTPVPAGVATDGRVSGRRR